MLVKSVLLALGLGASLAAALVPLEVRGSAFVNPETGDKFQIVGVAYQPGGSAAYNPALREDPLSNGTVCMRDAALMQILGVNTIRVYNLDPDINHDECASIFNAAGMYMLLDVNSPLVGESLDSGEPWTTYYKGYLNRTMAVVEAFSGYNNTLLFFSGNEVIDNVESAKFVPPYLRAVTRDLKQYIKNHVSRDIPVGYSAADVRDVLFDTYNYMQCDLGDDGLSKVDIFALNSYSWCGNSDFHTSTYDQLVNGFNATSVPVFFSEYGCNKPAPRIFTEVGTIYSDLMMPVMSGGLIYEYSQEASNFGLVQINDDGSAQLLQDYHTLAAQYAKLDFSSVEGGKPAATTPNPPQCDASLIQEVGFDNNFTLPSVPDDGSQDVINNGVSPKPSGQFVPITDWTVKLTVKDVDGSVIQNLAVKPLNGEANQPGTNTGSSVPAPSPSGKNAAPIIAPGVAAAAIPLLAALFV